MSTEVAAAGTPVAAPGEEAGSRRWLWPWDAFLAVGHLAVTALVLADRSVPIERRAVAAGCFVAIGLSWFAVGRRLARDDDLDRSGESPAAVGYVIVVVAVFVGAVTAAGPSTFGLFVICPVGFLCLRLGPAVVAAAVANVAPVPVRILRDGTTDLIGIDLGIAVLGVAFAALIGVAIVTISRQSAERAQLIADLEASRAEVAALSHEAGVSAERTRLAADIHDTLAQGFTSIVTLVQAAESELDSDRPAADRHLALALRTARENLAEARAMVTVLAPPGLRAGTLADVVRKQVARLAEETGVDAAVSVDGSPAGLPTQVEVVLVRALQESLANVRKHACASAVTVDLVGSDDRVTLTVDDDGVGFGAPRAGFGVPGMRTRVEQLGGTFRIRSAPGKGTTVVCEVPR